jgi:adenylate kinase
MGANYIVLLGLPGVGKGTLAKKIAKTFPIVPISCGDVFRQHVISDTPFGRLAKGYIEQGQLTPDDATSEMFLAHLSNQPAGSNYLIEGFPRSIAQAHALLSYFSAQKYDLKAVLSMKALPEVLIERLQFRQICPACGAIYNLKTDPPKRAETCDHDGRRLVQRADDKHDLLGKRIALYKKNEDEVLAFYDSKGLVVEIDANGTAGSVFDEAKKIIAMSFLAN